MYNDSMYEDNLWVKGSKKKMKIKRSSSRFDKVYNNELPFNEGPHLDSLSKKDKNWDLKSREDWDD